jgi:hypothetical protein
VSRSRFEPASATPRWFKVGLTILEPLGYAVAGGALAVVVGAGALLLVLPPAGLVLGFVRLARRYPEPHTLPSDQATEGRHIQSRADVAR